MVRQKLLETPDRGLQDTRTRGRKRAERKRKSIFKVKLRPQLWTVVHLSSSVTKDVIQSILSMG